MAELQTFEDITYTNEDFTETAFPKGEYVGCQFHKCDFTKANLSHIDFMDCTFVGCTLSLAVVKNTSLKDVQFEQCQLNGINFSEASDFLFAVSFATCSLDYSIFYKKKLKKTRFSDSSVKNVDFEGVDLTEANFDGCDLQNASFQQTNLTKADFRKAFNYTIDPEANTMTKAKLALSGVAGLLRKYNLTIEVDLN